MTITKYKGWPVDVTAIINCDTCGCSNVDMACGSPSESVRSCEEEGWVMKAGKVTCRACLADPGWDKRK